MERLNELKRCPFCGGEAKIEWEEWKEISPTSGIYRLSVEHSLDCMFVRMNGLNIRSEMISKTREKLIETWNTRKPMERIVKRFEEAKFPQKFGGETKMMILADKAIEIVKEEGGLNAN